MVPFALTLDRRQRRSGSDGESVLVDDLIAGIQFRDDEVNRRPERQHVASVSVLVRMEAGERWQQAVMQIDDPPASESPAGARRQDAHVASQQDVIDVVLIEELNHPRVVGIAFRISDIMPVDAELLGDATASGTVADHHGRSRLQPPVTNGSQHRQSWLRPIGRADRQSRRSSVLIARPCSDRQTLHLANLIHARPQCLDRLVVGGPVHASEHREKLLGVVVVHLDFVDVRPGRCEVVNDRVGQTAIIRADGGDRDVHEQNPFTFCEAKG